MPAVCANVLIISGFSFTSSLQIRNVFGDTSNYIPVYCYSPLKYGWHPWIRYDYDFVGWYG